MGNCLSTLEDCIEVIRNRNTRAIEPKEDKHQHLLKRILMLEEHTAEQDFNIKNLKTQLSHLEVRRLADRKKIYSLGESMRKAKDTLEQSPKKCRVSFQETSEYRLEEIEETLKDLRLKLEVQESLLRELYNERYCNKDDDGKLIEVLERGIKEGKKHLENLEELFDPLSLLIDSDTSLRQLMKDEKYCIKETRI